MLPELKRRMQLARPPRKRRAGAKSATAATATAATTASATTATAARSSSAAETASAGSSSGSEDDEDGGGAAASGGGGTSSLTIRQLATVLYALAELGYAPAGKSGGGWLRSYWGAVAAALEQQQQQQQQQRQGAVAYAAGAWRGGGEEVQALANLLHSAAELRLAPPPALMEALMGRCRGLLAAFPPQALSSTAWSLHRLRVQPPAEWLGAFMQACGGEGGGGREGEGEGGRGRGGLGVGSREPGTGAGNRTHPPTWKGRVHALAGFLAFRRRHPKCANTARYLLRPPDASAANRLAMPRMSCTELATLLYGLSRGLEGAGMAPGREWLRRAEGEWLQAMDRSGVSGRRNTESSEERQQGCGSLILGVVP